MANNRNEEMRSKLLMRPDPEAARRQMEADPGNPELRYAYAMSLPAGQGGEAVEILSEGLVHAPFSALLYFGRGRKFIAPRRYGLALADLTMAVRLDPDVYSHWYYRAVVGNLSGRYPQAIADFRQAMQRTEPFERYGLIDWLFTTYVEMGDMEAAKAVLDEIGDDIQPPQMHYGYKRRVRLYKGLIPPEGFIDEEDILAHCVKQENRLALEVATLLFGLYIYYRYTGEETKADETLCKLLENPYPGAFGTIKAEKAARERGLTR